MTDKMGICAIVPCGQQGIRPQVIGMGILVTDTEVVTCAHVINEALGLNGEKPTADAVVCVCFPFHDDTQSFQGAIDGERWFPPTKNKGASDIAAIRLRVPAPDSVERAVFQRYTRTKAGDLPLSVYGFRAATRPDGTWVSSSEGDRCTGSIVGSIPGGRGQFDGLRITGVAVQHGFSGAGIYDPNPDQDAIVGMIVEADRDEAKKLSHFIDTPTLESRGIRASHVPALLKTYLECISSNSDAVPAHMIKRSVLQQVRNAPPGPAPAAPAPAPESLESAVDREGKQVLLGDPGTGKSTALKYLERQVSRRMLADSPASAKTWIPVRIELKTYGGDPDLANLLASQVHDVLAAKDLAREVEESKRLMKSWLNNNYFDFLILLDALDEVPRSFHYQIRQALTPLLKSRHRFVISLRLADYDETLGGLVPFLLVALQPDEIRDYLERTLGAKGVALFQEQLMPNRARLDLATNPLLLEIMAEIIRQNPKAKLPPSSGQLLKSFQHEMQRQRRRGLLPDVPPDIVSEALGKLGFEMMDRGKPTATVGDIREWDITYKQYELEKVLLEAKRSRFLRSDGSLDSPVEFLHAQFTSYFAATYLNKQLKRPAADYGKVLGSRIDDPRWEQTITMLAGISEQAGGLVRRLAQQLRVKADVGSLFPPSSPSRWLEWIFQIGRPTRVDLFIERWEISSARDDPDVRSEVVDALRRVVRSCGRHVRDGRAWLAMFECNSALSALGRIGDERALTDLDWFIRLEHGPYKQSLPAFFWKPLERRLFDHAQKAAAEIQKNAGGAH